MLMKHIKWIILSITAMLYLQAVLPVCAETITLATIWSTTSSDNGMDINFDTASRRVQKARQGFEEGIASIPDKPEIREILIAENSDVRKYMTDIAELYENQDILMTVGAITDEATMYASMEMNFFGVPMLIPFADGFSGSDTNSSNSVRLMPTAQKYANYFSELFSANMFSFLNTLLFKDSNIPYYNFDVVIFFANNYNGHNTAVNITEEIMGNGFNIESYTPYEMTRLLQTVRNSWLNFPEKMESAEVVIIIGEDGDPLNGLSDVYHLWKDNDLDPIFLLVGYVPDMLTNDLAKAEKVFAVQPALDMSKCPSDISNRSEALGYAAGYITARAITEANKTQKKEPSGIALWFRSDARKREIHQEYISSFRINIQTNLLKLNEDIPCYGHVNFNLSTDNQINMEMVHYTSPDSFVVVDGPSVLMNSLLQKLTDQYGDYIDSRSNE